MTDHEFDQALISAAFTLAAASGWAAVTPAAAAREAGLKLEQARIRFPNAQAILLRFGQFADEQALTDALDSGAVRERLFDVVMRRFDALQQHRAGVLALLDSLPADPGTALVLAVLLATAWAGCWRRPACRRPAGAVQLPRKAWWLCGCTPCVLGGPTRHRTSPAPWPRWTAH